MFDPKKLYEIAFQPAKHQPVCKISYEERANIRFRQIETGTAQFRKTHQQIHRAYDGRSPSLDQRVILGFGPQIICCILNIRHKLRPPDDPHLTVALRALAR
jgi:hypothetical protein